MIRFGTLFAVLFVTSASAVDEVSLIQLLAAPEKFHSKQVRVHGVSHIEFESNGIFLSKEHWRNLVTGSALWIRLAPELAKAEQELQKLNGSYVFLEGVFDMNSKGHFGLYAGTIKDVTVLKRSPFVRLPQTRPNKAE